MIKDNDQLFNEMASMSRKSSGGKARVGGGIAVLGLTLLLAGSVDISNSFSSSQNGINAAEVLLAGVLVGGGLMAGGFTLKAGTKKLSLDPIRIYNDGKFQN